LAAELPFLPDSTLVRSTCNLSFNLPGSQLDSLMANFCNAFLFPPSLSRLFLVLGTRGDDGELASLELDRARPEETVDEADEEDDDDEDPELPELESSSSESEADDESEEEEDEDDEEDFEQRRDLLLAVGSLLPPPFRFWLSADVDLNARQ
jgi:hypothetical protein